MLSGVLRKAERRGGPGILCRAQALNPFLCIGRTRTSFLQLCAANCTQQFGVLNLHVTVTFHSPPAHHQTTLAVLLSSRVATDDSLINTTQHLV